MIAFRQLTGLAGVGFVAVVVAANAAVGSTSPPRGETPVGTLVSYFVEHASAVAAGVGLSPLAWVALATLTAGLVSAIRPYEREHGEGWSLIGLIGMVMQNCIFAGVVGTQAAVAALAAGPEPAAGGVAGLWALHNALFALNGTSLALAMTGFSIGARRAGVIPTWHAAVGLAGAALLLTGTLEAAGVAGVGLLSFAGFALWMVWILTWSIRLLVPARASAPRPATSPAPATA